MSLDSKVADWLQIVASLGVIVGLLFVAYEVRESNRIATSEDASSISDQFIALSRSEYESNIYDLFVKSAENPGDLSSAEILKLSSWYTSIIQIYGRWLNNYELGTARYDGLEDLKYSVNYYFGHKSGRAWFDQNRYWIDSRIAEVIASELIATPEWAEPPEVAGFRSHF